MPGFSATFASAFAPAGAAASGANAAMGAATGAGCAMAGAGAAVAIAALPRRMTTFSGPFSHSMWVTSLFSTSSTSFFTSSSEKPPAGRLRVRSGCFSGRVAIDRVSCPKARSLAATRVRYSPVRVSMRRISPSLMKSGTLTT